MHSFFGLWGALLEGLGAMDDHQKVKYDLRPGGRDYVCSRLRYFGIMLLDVMIFLKLAPAVIGIAGLLTYLMMRAREPDPDLELAKIVQRVRNIFLLLGCVALIMLSVWLLYRPAPPDHDISLSALAAGVSNILST